MNYSTAICYCSDRDPYPCLKGHLPHALTNWAIFPPRKLLMWLAKEIVLAKILQDKISPGLFGIRHHLPHLHLGKLKLRRGMLVTASVLPAGPLEFAINILDMSSVRRKWEILCLERESSLSLAFRASVLTIKPCRLSCCHHYTYAYLAMLLLRGQCRLLQINIAWNLGRGFGFANINQLSENCASWLESA